MKTTSKETVAPRAYIGTYAKYNNGSLAGAWMILTDYENYDAFLAACKQIHRDEPDPEFMCQDVESMPDGVTLSEDFSRQDFEDVLTAYREEEKSLQEESLEETEKGMEQATETRFRVVDYSEKALAVYGDTKEIKEQLKQLGGRFNARLRDGAGWIFSKQKAEELQALLSGAPMEGEKNHTPKAKRENPITEYQENLKKWIRIYHPNDEDYYLKYYYGAVKWSYHGKDYYYNIRKESIKTYFPFHDEGPGYEYYLEVTKTEGSEKAYFMTDNMKYYNAMEHNSSDCFCYSDEYGESYIGGWQDRYNTDETPEEIKDHVREINKALAAIRLVHEKRLQIYLKRWGIRKLRFDTYWADR